MCVCVCVCSHLVSAHSEALCLMVSLVDGPFTVAEPAVNNSTAIIACYNRYCTLPLCGNLGDAESSWRGK